MALFKWDHSYSVNVIEIDLQHQKLVSMINELNDAMKQGKGKDILGKIVNGLITYTKTHFKTEEKYFDRFGYSGTNSHKHAHIAFIKKVSEFKENFENGNRFITIEVVNFLINWLQEHIKGADKKYSQFFNEKGLK